MNLATDGTDGTRIKAKPNPRPHSFVLFVSIRGRNGFHHGTHGEIQIEPRSHEGHEEALEWRSALVRRCDSFIDIKENAQPPHRRDATMNRFVSFVTWWFNLFLFSVFSVVNILCGRKFGGRRP
jgi:hypothetical protein